MHTLEQTHVVTDPAILYVGTPVVPPSTVNPDGSPNLAPSRLASIDEEAYR